MKSLIKPLNRLRVVDSRRREPNWKENDEILNAAGVNDVNTLQHLSSKGVDITAACNWNEASTLHIASQRGSCQVVELLLDVKAKPNAITNTKSMPLHYAASGGHQQVVKLLIDAKAPINCKDKDNKTPLHLAANRGHYQVVRMLVDAGAVVDARDKNGNTPLANAVSNNHHIIVKYLITEAKADISKISKDMQQRYKSHCQPKCSNGQTSASVQLTPSRSPVTQHQQRYVQQQRCIQQQTRQVHLMQRTQQHQRSASQQQIERTSTHQQQQCRTFHLQISKQQPSSIQQHSQEQLQQSQQKVQLTTQLHQLFQLELEIEIPPSQGNEQAVQEQLVQKQAQVKKQQIVKSTLTSTASLNYQEEKSTCIETQQLQREQLSAKTSLVEGKIEQKQQKLIVKEAEEEVVCTEEEVFYEEDHSRLCEIEQEMNESTSNCNPLSDVTDCHGNKSGNDNDNDETCSEHDAVTIGINSTTMNVIATQEVVQQVTGVDQSCVHKDHSNTVTDSLTTLTGQHSPHYHSSQQQQPHPPCAIQQTTNGVTSVNVQNGSLQPDLHLLPNLPHQQSYNCYPDYQPTYPQQGPTNTLPNHYLPVHPLPPPHHLYRHYTLPMTSQYHHPPFAHCHQQSFQQHPYGMDHRSSSPAVLEQSSLLAPTHLQAVPEYPHYPYGMEHRSSSPAVLEQSSYHHTAALQVPNTTQLPSGHQQFPHHTEHRSSSPAVLEQPTHHHYTAVPQINTMQYNVQPTAAGRVITHDGLVSPQRPSPAMSTSPAMTSTSPLPAVFLRQPDVKQQQLPYSNNSPNGPQHIDLQVQELTRRIEELKSQREAYERTIKQDQNEQISHDLMGERRVVTPVIHVKEERIHKHPSETTTEESPTLSTTPSQLFTASSSENSSNQSLHSIPYNYTPTPTGSHGRITPNNLPLQQSLESTSTNASDTMSTVPHTVINSNTPDLPSDSSPVTSNAEVTSVQTNRQQQNCANQIVSNLFSNFQSPSQAGPGANVVVQMLFMQDNNIAFPPSRTQSIECGEDNHNSLKPFTTDICSAIDVNTILPFMVTKGLLSSSQHQYFLNPYHTTNDKQNKLTCIAVTINEDCVEKFLQCLEETSDYEPHETLLKKIRNAI